MLDNLSAFVRTLLTPSDVGMTLQQLAVRTQEALGLHGAGVSVAHDDALRFITAVPAGLAEIEKEQSTTGGPLLEAFRAGRTVTIEDLDAHREQWPRYCELARDGGVRAAAGIPMRVGEQAIGVLSLYSSEPRKWGPQDLSAARLYADLASVFIINSSSYDRQLKANEQLQHALDSRVIIEQAKGIVAESYGLDMEEAFERIRRHARSHHVSLRSVAEAIVNLRMRL
ncbi:MAG TPA: GAF and ANTAR domain-containing protein [Beutenbergiaceae bacterium]|nr:GAF and ANTAR domain-containing protein [Beutenbergiaceae bacterium]